MRGEAHSQGTATEQARRSGAALLGVLCRVTVLPRHRSLPEVSSLATSLVSLTVPEAQLSGSAGGRAGRGVGWMERLRGFGSGGCGVALYISAGRLFPEMCTLLSSVCPSLYIDGF